ncbi:TPA: hypothetical protein ACS72K_003796 [Providencia alcalifaciens]|uniref:hypothetical protein n=1 Tax=Providencia TaxID=586 RepID=UPI0012B56A8B|nr:MULTISPECIES: hypothetical protein [unclassified Providencia]MTC22064.1 hypothetical protein [Providencia sp. wls1938]MTC44333.1 hypothetical protein [Providencia sp. wls1922]MTC76032.1 hypothetical protein [Providencia sp. wls1919]
MKKEITYVLGALAILVIIYFAVMSFKVTDKKIYSAVEASVSEVLLDPQSAQFSKLKIVERVNDGKSSSMKVCGYVNAKNSFGGFTGNKGFYTFVYIDNGNIKIHKNSTTIASDLLTKGMVEHTCNY